MEQLSINWQEAATQPRELARVKSVIAGLILSFWRAREVGAQFHMQDLTDYVKAHTTIAPDSAGRVLRDLRQAKELNYSVIDRRQSLYRIEDIQDAAAPRVASPGEASPGQVTQRNATNNGGFK